MTYKKCPKCEINYITNETDELCSVCKADVSSSTGKTLINKRNYIKNSSNEFSSVRSSTSKTSMDDNKYMVEQYLLPILRNSSPAVLQSFTEKEVSFNMFGLRLPLLVECRGYGSEACKQEIIVDASRVYRYYVQPYNINGKKYHICSQWWSASGNNSKDILSMLKEIKS